jgi:lysophospholipase L1-like esterase
MSWWRTSQTRRTALSALVSLVAAGCSTPRKAGVPSRSFQGRTRVACVGDSITAGSGLAQPEVSAYPAVLGQLLGNAYEVRNFGVSGATLLKDGDHPYAATAQFEAARQFLPQVVVIALGTNDSKPQNWKFRNTFERDLYAMVRAFLTLPNQPTVYICTPPTVFQDHWGITAGITSHQIAPAIRRASAREGWPLIDLELATRVSASSFPDGIHPDAVGAANLAMTVETAFRGR